MAESFDYSTSNIPDSFRMMGCRLMPEFPQSWKSVMLCTVSVATECYQSALFREV